MPEGIRLDQINIVAADVKRSAAFYSRLGLHFDDGGPPEWQLHHQDARTDGADVDLDSETFAAQWNEGWPGGSGVVLGFRVPARDDVDRLYAALTADGHPGQQQPYDTFWGVRFAVVSDPDGNAVALMSPADPDRRSPPVLPT